MGVNLDENTEVEPTPVEESVPTEPVEALDATQEPAPEVSEEEKTPAPEWVKELRRSHRELQKRNRELERMVESKREPEKPLAPKPKLADFDYEAEKYETALDAWYEQKRIYDETLIKKRDEQQSAEARWRSRVDAYTRQKQEFLGKHDDYDLTESLVQEILSPTQQGILLQGSNNSALVVYTLGKNPSKARELAKITDPVEFAYAMAKYEMNLKGGSRSAPPPPEKVVNSTKAPASTDSTLEKLRREAEKTGDYSKILQYKMSLRNQAR